MNEFPGFTHVAVTVSDLARSTAWYADLFGSAPVLDEDVEAGAFHHTVFALGGGNLFGLHKHVNPGAAPFDERSPGLDHVSFSCGDRAELEKWSRPTGRARRRPRRDRRRPLRVGAFVPRPGRHRPGVLRSAVLTEPRPRQGETRSYHDKAGRAASWQGRRHPGAAPHPQIRLNRLIRCR